jgi:gamma-glutamyltranspeptidase/glutathione hydrolase
MTPTIVLRDGRPVLVLGAAGSERIPGAILQVVSHVLDRGLPVEEALRAPRVFSADAQRIRLWDDTPPHVREALRKRGFELDVVPRGPRRHLGIVHVVARDSATGAITGAADPVYDGAALHAPTAKSKPARN